MSKNVALFGRRELQAHRRFVTGLTASRPTYKEVDPAGNKEWVVDVYIGPLDNVELNIIRDVPVSPYARQVVGDIRQPVLLERSKQGRYTLVGRAKHAPAGAQMPEGSILEPTYHRVEYNLAELNTRFIADVTYKLEGWGEKTWNDGGPWQAVDGVDAFGNVVVGEDAEDPPALLAIAPAVVTTTRHTILTLRAWNIPGNQGGFRWGIDSWNASYQKVVELTS